VVARLPLERFTTVSNDDLWLQLKALESRSPYNYGLWEGVLGADQASQVHKRGSTLCQLVLLIMTAASYARGRSFLLLTALGESS
jgi:hypothetical protein